MDQTKIGTESDGNLTAQLEESSRLQEIGSSVVSVGEIPA